MSPETTDWKPLGVAPVVGGEGTFQVRLGVALAVEWNRTRRTSAIHRPGRFYLRFANRRQSLRAYAESRRIYGAIGRWVSATPARGRRERAL